MKVHFDGHTLDMQAESDADVETLKTIRDFENETTESEKYFNFCVHLALDKNLVLKVEYI